MQKVSLETRLLIGLEKERIGPFTIDDAQKMTGASRAATSNVLTGMVKKKLIGRFKRGMYVYLDLGPGEDDFWAVHHLDVVRRVIRDCYVGYWTAMNQWGMTEQWPLVVHLGCLTNRKDMAVGGMEFWYHKIPKEEFFGAVQLGRPGDRFWISSREKTIVDALIHPEYSGGMVEAAKAVWYSQNVNWEMVLAMIRRTGKDAAFRRLGFLLHKFEKHSAVAERIARMEFEGIVKLDPMDKSNDCKISSEYGVEVNMTDGEILGWIPY